MIISVGDRICHVFFTAEAWSK